MSENDTFMKSTPRSYFNLSQPLQKAHALIVRKKETWPVGSKNRFSSKIFSQSTTDCNSKLTEAFAQSRTGKYIKPESLGA